MKKYLKYMLVLAAAFMFLVGIKAEAKSLKISSPAKTMYVKQEIQLKVTPSSMKNKVKWKSSDKKVATVSKNGAVTAKKAGKVKIYAVSAKNSKEKAVYQIKVKKFQEKTLSANCSVIHPSSEPLPSIGRTYKVFHSKKEIDEFLKEDKDGFYASYSFKEKLKEYNKSFFNKKSLCIVYITTTGSGCTPVKVESIQLVQNKKGKVAAKLLAEIGLQGPDEMWTADVASFYAVAELDKADAEMIQDYKVEMFSELPYTPGIEFFD